MNKIKGLYYHLNALRKQEAIRRSYIKLYEEIFHRHPELNSKKSNENEWLTRWKQYDSSLSIASYRIFASYIGEDLDIMPLEICANLIEPKLNPSEYSEFYGDKNSLNLLINDDYMPHTVVRDINGHHFSQHYQNISNITQVLALCKYDKLILKPSLECSGQGVQLLTKKNEMYFTRTGELVSEEYLLKNYHRNYLIQECIEQSNYMAQFNPTSINTIRIFTYRDTQGEVHAMRSILRIGGRGSNVDNAHSGGMFCGIDQNGYLGLYCCSWLGDITEVFNDIDFKNSNFLIPNFNKVKEFSVDIAKHIPHHDLVALDIALDKNNVPKLVEINIGGFSAWLFQFTVGPVFGSFTNEIINRCKAK